MPAIANYYAQVGIHVDSSGAAKVTRYLNGIKKQMLSFQKQLGKTAEVSLRVKIDTKRSLASINREMKILSGAASMTIRNVSFSRSEIIKGLNKTISGSHGRTNLRVGALLSQESLSGMRAQLRASINSLVVSPTIRPNVVPRVRRGSGALSGGDSGGGGGPRRRSMGGLSPFSKRGMNPWYNPMMVGGGVGAFLRYGAYSLPFVAGAMGLNALSGNVQAIQNARLAMTSQIGDRNLAERELNFLRDIGRVHGTTIQSMAPSYGQIYASAQGTEMEKYLQPIFKGFIQYASVKGLGSEQKAGAMLAMSQMVGLRGKGIGQEIRQMINQGIPEFRKLMAEAVAGGDEEKLADMLQKGTFGMEGLIKTFLLMRDKAQPFLPDYYRTVERNRGTLKQANEEFITSFYEGGGAAGLGDFYRTLTQVTRDAIGSADEIGAAFEKVSRVIQAAILAPVELKDWFTGEMKDGNFFQHYFGASDNIEAIQKIKDIFNSIEEMQISLSDNSTELLRASLQIVAQIADILLPVVSALMDSFSIGLYAITGKTNTAFWLAKKNAKSSQVTEDIENEFPSATPGEKRAMLKARMTIWEAYNPKPENEPAFSNVGAKNVTVYRDAKEAAAAVSAANKAAAQAVIDAGGGVPFSNMNWLERFLAGQAQTLATSVGVGNPELPNATEGFWERLMNFFVPSSGAPSLTSVQPQNGNVTVNVVVSGDIGVKPDEAFSPTLQAAVGNEANRAIENALRGFFPATGGGVIGGRPQ